MILCTTINKGGGRGDSYKYLNGELKLDEFEEKDSPYAFYEEWSKKAALNVLEKLYVINIIYSN